MKNIIYLIFLIAVAIVFNSCAIRANGGTWITGHYEYSSSGGRHWVPGHYAR
jgi:hypothetical protein